ncbi:MAG: response regulator [Oscillospiraceae bacterium]|nr:response regulator [Oscillospiraceae bacterium]
MMNKAKKPLILAVDNARMFLTTLKRILEDEPYELHCETSCDDALKYLETNHPELILLDIEMPDMDGYELARRIKGMGKGAPILFITANSDKEHADKAREAGAEGLLIKPLRRNQLMEKINEFIK